MRAKITGRYADTPNNRSFLSRLSTQLADVIKRPKAYKAIRSRSKSSAAAMSGQKGIGNLRYIDKGNFSDVEVRRGKLVRWRNEKTESGTLTVVAVQILNPGPNLISRLKRMAKTTEGMRMTRETGNLFGQIRGRPFVTQKFADGTHGSLIKAAIRYWQDWKPHSDKEELLESVSVIYHKFKRDFPDLGLDMSAFADLDEEGDDD